MIKNSARGLSDFDRRFEETRREIDASFKRRRRYTKCIVGVGIALYAGSLSLLVCIAYVLLLRFGVI